MRWVFISPQLVFAFTTFSLPCKDSHSKKEKHFSRKQLLQIKENRNILLIAYQTAAALTHSSVAVARKAEIGYKFTLQSFALVRFGTSLIKSDNNLRDLFA
jgi:hypothetical protein